MQQLLETYSVGEIVIFLVFLITALREFIGLIDFFKARGRLQLNREKEKEENSDSLRMLGEKIDKIENQLNSMSNQLRILTESDRDDIKSWLVEKYNYYNAFPARKLSTHTMDTIEKRYSHYKEEGGNSYIDNTILPGLREMAKEEQRVEL